MMHTQMDSEIGLMTLFEPNVINCPTESAPCVSVLQDHQLRPDPASDHCVGAGGVSCSPGR